VAILIKGNSKEGLKRSAAEKPGHFSPKGMITRKEEAAMPISSGNHVVRKTRKSVRKENQPGSSEKGKELYNPKQKLTEAPGSPG
jgi:hypothetical protein